MSVSLSLRSSTAAAAAFIVAGWGAFAAPAAAGPDHGNGNSQGNASSAGNANNAQGPQGEGAKGHQGNGHGAKGNNGKGPEGNPGNGPKGNNGNGPHGDNGNAPKGNNGNHGTAADKGPHASASADDTDTGGAGGAGDPAGNNGTVKITPHLEDDGTPQNTPHVTCIFDIEWYGFDEGEEIWSTVEFAMQAPTTDVALSGTDPSQVFVGEDPASGAGTDSGFDGEATYSLVFDGVPHPQQGYHVALTVHTPGSQGADTKHKVFWVEPCEEEAVVPEAGAADAETPPGEAEESSDEAGALGETGGDDEAVTESDAAKAESDADTAETIETSDDAAAMGTSAGAAGSSEVDVPNSVDAGGAGARIADLVSSPWSLLLMALGLALGGAALVARRRTV